MMMTTMKKFVISNSRFLRHSVIAVSHFSTNPNPNIPFKPKPRFPYSSDPSHARLQHLLLDKSKVGFDKLDDALQVFDKMLLTKPLLPVINFNQLLAALVKMKHYSVAVSLFRDMHVNSIPVNIFTITTIINCFCHLDRVDFAFSLLAGIIKHGFVPDVVTYNTLIRGLISQDMLQEAQLLFQNLIRFQLIQPDVVTYNIIIDGICKRGNPSVAVKLFKIMEKKGCKPDTVTYTTLIDCLCKHGLVDQALGLLHQMTRKGVSPVVMTYNSLVQGLCDNNRWHDVKQLLEEMDVRNISRDVFTYSILVDAYCKEGMIEDAEDVIELMIQRGVYPNLVTYNSLMDGYCLQGKVNKALAVFESLKRKGILPNTFSYTILINGYCRKKKVDRAIDLFQEMPSEGLTPTIETYSTILQGFFHAGRHVEARKFFKEKMINQGVEFNNVTCRILLHGLCQNSYVFEALSFLQILESSGLVPDIQIYTILIDGLSKNGHLENARSLFDNLPLKGLRPDVKTYTMMIQAYCHEGLLDEANELFRKMEANECLPNDVTYNMLIRGCLQNKNYYEAGVLLDEMLGRGFAADASTASVFVDLLDVQEQDPALLSLCKKYLPYRMSLFKRFQEVGYPALEDGPAVESETRRAWQIYSCFGPFCFFHLHERKESQPSNSGSWENVDEAEFVVLMYHKLLARFVELKSSSQIAIISPYRSQVSLFRDKFKDTFGEDSNKFVDINTVDGFQGREKDVAIFSCVRENECRNYQSKVVGSALTLRKDEHWKNLTESAEKRNLSESAEKRNALYKKTRMENVVTYSSLMDGYCLRGEVDKALAVFESMKRKGILPNTFSYNILINGYCKKFKVDIAIDLFQQMPSEGLTPTIETYSTILQGFFHVGRHVEARKFFMEKMINQGVELNNVTCGILLHGLCQNCYVFEALSFFQILESSGLVADIQVYTILIDGLSKNGHLENARSLFDNLPAKGLRPNVKTYTVMIQAYCHEGLLDEANELFREMEAHDCLPSDVTYNMLIRGCLQNKNYYEAGVLMDEMLGRGFAADASTASVLLDLLDVQEQDPAPLALCKKYLP
ncbi:pentatricopeptide repeat-containing protein At1g63130, mitochondrial-like [Daucus carota subsp. sativus]